MPRPLRFIPPNSVVEITARTVGSRFLLRPGPAVNDLIVGVIGRAQVQHPVRIHAIAFLSNHMHALVSVDDARQLAAFMQHVLTNISKEVGRFHRWKGPLWSRRYRAIVLADRESQARRLSYVLCQGLKEGLVRRVAHWPGVSSVATLTRGKRLQGTWFDRTAQFHARQKGLKPDPRIIERTYDVKHTPIPEMAHLAAAAYASLVTTLVRHEEERMDEERVREGKGVLGAARILEQDPHTSPALSAKSPAPFVHGVRRRVRRAFVAAYRRFALAFRVAAEALKRGVHVDFPEGAFPPARPFVAAAIVT